MRSLADEVIARRENAAPPAALANAIETIFWVVTVDEQKQILDSITDWFRSDDQTFFELVLRLEELLPNVNETEADAVCQRWSLRNPQLAELCMQTTAAIRLATKNVG